MSKYDEIKKKHKVCKDEMSSRTWKAFAVDRKLEYCPVCGEER